jgi:hypothetical protein
MRSCRRPAPRRCEVFDPKETRALAIFNAAPELLLRGQKQVLIERIGGNAEFDPFAADLALVNRPIEGDWPRTRLRSI